MFDNSLQETPYVEQLYTEYLQQINRYKNLYRQSVFCRYYNINIKLSDFDSKVNGTFDRYNSGIMYDVYDYTPLFSVTPIVNESENSEDMFGQKFIANADITTYTINEPRIEDLVIFNNKPNDGNEIFRVINIRASINSMNSDPNIHYFQSSIEYAPIVDLSKLNIMNRYCYCLPMEKYLFQNDFVEFVKNVSLFNKILNKFQYKFFDTYHELYFVNINGNCFFPKYENRIIYDFLAKRNFLSDQFASIKRPYTVTQFTKKQLKNDALDNNYISFYKNKSYKVNIANLDENYPYDIFDICDIINQWIWYYNYEKYPVIKKESNIYFNSEDKEYDIEILNDSGLLYRAGSKSNLLVNIRELDESILESAYGSL